MKSSDTNLHDGPTDGNPVPHLPTKSDLQAPGSGTEETGTYPGSESAPTDPRQFAFDVVAELRVAFGDRYALGPMLGRGGFGAVYRAHDQRLSRDVAIKASRPRSADPDQLLREARSLAQLRHPGIVTVHDVAVTPTCCLVVSELLRGPSLAQWLEDRRPEPAQAVRIVAAVADALAHAHERSIVHRDVKPSNIAFADDDRPVLVDFGLALSDLDAAAELGVVSGTPSYMSPEQAGGRGHRPDGPPIIGQQSQSEWATDVIFNSPKALAELYPRLLHHGITTFGSRDVLRFLQQKVPAQGGVHGRFAGEVVSDLKSRPEGVRIKHSCGENSVKMYDKQGQVLRVETTIHDANGLKVYRPVADDPGGPSRWQPLRKGIADLHRRCELSQAANERYLEALAAVESATPLEKLSVTMCRSVLAGKLQGQFVTAAYLYLDLEKGTGSYSAAGHPPLLHYRAADATVHGVVENGLILGIMPFASYESKALNVASGDRFLLYTDGVLEADKGGEEFGEARVKSLIQESTTAEEICHSVSAAVSAWSKGVAGDDITIVAVDIA